MAIRSGRVVVADTSALVALISPKDFHRAKAERMVEAFVDEKMTVVVPGDILTETVNVLQVKYQFRLLALRAAAYLSSDNLFLVKETTERIRVQALEYFRVIEHASLADCLVMAFAIDLKTERIFGFDRAFAENGFVVPD